MTLVIDLFSQEGDVLFELFVGFDEVRDFFTGMHRGGVIASTNLVANGGIRTLNLFA